MSKLIIMVGLPGSGKSYWANNLYNELNQSLEPTVILSSDNYRKKMYGDESDQTHNNEVFSALYSDMRKYLSDGKNVIFDATNTTLKARRRIFNEIHGIKDINYIIAYVICPPIEKCYEQNNMRERRVQNYVIDKFYRSFQFPQMFEGFDMIWVNDGNEEYADDGDMPEFSPDEYNVIIERMNNFDQKNPHHKYSLGMHCDKAADAAFDMKPSCYQMYLAAKLHDIGKLFTQSIDENGVAHYYNHDSIGTYYLASHLNLMRGNDWDDIFEVLFYVNYHMRAHRDFKSPKAEKKYRNIFGDELFDRLMIFGQCDRLASGTYHEHEELLKEQNKDEE